MPFHRFYIPRGLYTAEEKQALAKAITDVYTIGSPTPLPPFYVVVNFINIEDGHFFVGGEKNNNFVRVVVHHLAVQHQEDRQKRNFMDRYEKAISPWTKDKGVDWEVQLSNQDPVFWNENGIQPPEMGSEAYRLWKETNKPIPY
ncbi:hypothetical protein E1B28_012224 [Marasmius oreades]|uniref:Tautomerase cis-CaaD-like domain-containing protein n=1 Tax=Marasmius oreades TaxID=181124 RepID=A0A9P7RRP6_9AGAR|nr:uncharacterized protein E1B28_012224 [Marasmius oreades]KAG7088207.1 hypothetical protein E1B28_012224 [Marasmius oreades]